MNVSSPILYGAAGALGIIGGAVTTLAFHGHDQRANDKYHAKIDAMTPDQLRQAASHGGVHKPTSPALAITSIGGGALLGTGLLFGAAGGFINFGGSMVGAGNMVSLRPAGVLLAAGAGALIGGAAMAGINSLRDR